MRSVQIDAPVTSGSAQMVVVATGGLALVAAVWAVVVSKTLFPLGSINHDEAVYRLQADALAHGHLFPVAPTQHPAAFIPWLSAYRAGHYVPKYAPVHAAVLAMARVVTGTDRAALAVIAASAVVATVVLAHEVLDNWGQSVLAGGLLVASPLFLIQSATYLSYLTVFVLLELLAFAVFRGARTGSRRWYLLAGFAGGLAFFARSYDAVLFGIPLLGFIVVETWRDRRTLARRIVWLGAGALPPLVALLLFNQAATGSALRPPFGLIDASDSIGFGNHRIYPAEPYLHFTATDGFLGVVRQLALTGFWCFGGLILIGLAAFALWRHGRHSPRWWLAAAGVMIPIGYFFFWGDYGSTIFGLPRYLGPFYYLPVLAPIVVLGAAGCTRLWHADRLVAWVGVAAMVGLSIFVAGRTIRTDSRLTVDDRRLNHGLTSAHLDHALVFLPQLTVPDLLVPFGTAIDHYGYTGKVVYALDEGPDEDAAIAAQFPGRAPYLLVVSGAYRADPPDPHLTSTLVPLSSAAGS